MEQLSEQHKTIAIKFGELYHDIQQQMCMFRKDRHNATIYLSEILKKYDSYVISGPNINSIVLNQFKKTFKNAEISVPDIADRIQKIEIITEPILPGENSNNLQNKFVPNILKVNNGNKDIDLEKNAIRKKRYSRYGNSNLKQISDVFKIHGDITDNDIQNANEVELKELRKNFLDSKSNFEIQRFKNHNQETD
jgi:hypothetical protein